MSKKNPSIEQQLRASEERYQAFIRNSHEGIWRVEVEQPIPINLEPTEQIKRMYKYAYLAEANQVMANMYGLKSVQNIVGARLGDLLVESDPANQAYLLAFIKSGYSLSGAESHETDRHGNDKYFLNSLVGVIEGGKITHAWGTQQDITELKRTLNRQHRLEASNVSLKRERTQLIALNDAKDEFISIASHQLRTPASSVKQYLGMLLEGYGGDLTDEQLSMIITAYDSNERQLKIITDLLRVAQVDAGKVRLVRAEIDVAQLLKEIIHDMKDAISHRRQTIQYSPASPKIIGSVDARLLRMVMENLLDNASKYSAAGSPITVRLLKDKQSIGIHIVDKGVGISTEDQQKLFQKFARIENPLTNAVTGTGLGLYWVKKVIDLHGGTVGLTSEPNQGTTFTITIPH